MTQHTSMPAKVVISIQASVGSPGAVNYLGPGTSSWIKSWLNDPSTVSILIDTWQKCLDTGQTTTVNLILWPSTQSWMLDLSRSSSKNTSGLFHRIRDGTPMSLLKSCSLGVLILLLAVAGGSLVSEMTTPRSEKQSLTIHKDQSQTSSIAGCSKSGG